MKLVSFDVGINNLSYCILEKTDDIKIIGWDNINITDNKVIFCDHCKNKAVYCGTDVNEKTQYICGKHKKKYIPYTDEWEKENIKVNHLGDTCCHIIKGKSACGKKSYGLFRENAYCKIHMKCILKKFDNDVQLSSLKKKLCSEHTPQKLSENMYRLLDKDERLREVDSVRIENQPSMMNPRVKSISGFIFSYFILRCVIDGKKEIDVKYISPSNKLKIDEKNLEPFLSSISKEDNLYNYVLNIFSDQTKLINNVVIDYFRYHITGKSNYDFSIVDGLLEDYHKLKKDSKKEYRVTKGLSILYTKYLLRDSEWLEHLAKYPKQDDLCDAYLQGIYCL